MARGTLESRPTSTVEQSTDNCPECDGSVEHDAASGDAACRDCGLVVTEDALDLGPEWRTIDGRSTQNRGTGSPTTNTLHDGGLSTTIGKANTDANGHTISGRKKAQVDRLRRHQTWALLDSNGSRYRITGLEEVQRLVSALELPDVVHEEAAQTFTTAHEAGLATGRDLDGLAAAAVYAACRVNRRPIVPEEVAEHAQADPNSISVAYGVMNRKLALEVAPFTPADHVPRLVDAVGLGHDAIHPVMAVTRTADQSAEFSGHSPSSVAASAVYVVHRDEDCVTQAALAEAGDVSEKTIQTNAQKLEECEEVALP